MKYKYLNEEYFNNEPELLKIGKRNILLAEFFMETFSEYNEYIELGYSTFNYPVTNLNISILIRLGSPFLRILITEMGIYYSYNINKIKIPECIFMNPKELLDLKYVFSLAKNDEKQIL